MTEREMEVARAMGRHLTFEEIAQELGISRRTVKQYADTIRLKMGVSKSREIPRILKELGVI